MFTMQLILFITTSPPEITIVSTFLKNQNLIKGKDILQLDSHLKTLLSEQL
jgi:hypothetical protein